MADPDPDEPMFELPEMESLDYGPSWGMILGVVLVFACVMVVITTVTWR